jgi:N6-adenosine-specific RNA methylase IME4
MNTAGEAIGAGPFAGVTVPPGGFRKIYADPAWGWRTWNALDKVPHRGAVAPYEPMTRDQLTALPVADLAASNCALFMWTVSSHLDQAIDLGRAWGFTFRSVAFIWIKTDKQGKPRMSLGRWTRQEAEVCLLFARGRPPRRPKPIGTNVRQVIMAQRREHSRKPDEIRERIDALVEGPAIELFSRSSAPGWAAWGDEVGKFDAVHTATLAASEAAAAHAGSTGACVAHRPGAVCHCPGCLDRRGAVMRLVTGAGADR